MKLEPAELLDRAKKLGILLDEARHHATESAAIRKKIGDTDKDFERKIALLGDVLKTGFEGRLVMVEAWADYANDKLLSVRTDTGETVAMRRLEPGERQGDFDLDDWRNQLHLGLTEALEGKEEVDRG